MSELINTKHGRRKVIEFSYVICAWYYKKQPIDNIEQKVILLTIGWNPNIRNNFYNYLLQLISAKFYVLTLFDIQIIRIESAKRFGIAFWNFLFR